MNAMENVDVENAPDRDRYEITVDGEIAGFTAYRARPGLIEFIHTEIDERFQGRGLADRLIRFALDDVRAQGLSALPFCPFVRAFIDRNREFAALIPDRSRAQF